MSLPSVQEVTNYILEVSTSSAPVSLTLPSLSTSQALTIKDISGKAGTNNITITPNLGGATIDGATNFIVNVNYQAVTFWWDGANFFVIQNNAGAAAASTPRIITTGTTDVATSKDTLIAWNSSTSGNKTETIPAPSSGPYRITIVDEIGTAGIYPITITPTSGTINGSASIIINNNYGFVTLYSDGISNLMQIT